MNKALKKARCKSGIATFERQCRTVISESRERLAWKVPGTPEAGRWWMLNRYTQKLAATY